MLYGRKCHTPLKWLATGEGLVFGLDILHEAQEKVQLVRELLKTTKSRQKSYVNSHHEDRSFQVGVYVYLQVTPLKGTERFRVKGKLTLR